MRALIKALLCVLVFSFALPAFACPCGCGSIKSGSLEPGQRAKAVTTLSSESHVSTITTSGKTIDDYFYDQARRVDFALTYALASDWTLTAAAGAYQNAKKGDASRMMPTDANLIVGYTIQREDFSNLLQPSIDAYVSYKAPLAKSFADAADNPTEDSFLEVGGNGLQEIAVGVQTWNSITNEWRVGSNFALVNFPTVIADSDTGPRHGAKASAQLTRVFMAKGGATFEAGMEWLGKTVDDRRTVAGSQRRVDHISIAGSMVVMPLHSIGASYTQKNVFGLTRNSVGGRSLAVSYQMLVL